MENTDVRIRPYKPEDREGVLALVHELETEMAEKFPDVRLKSMVSDYKNRYLKPGNKYVTYVGEIDGRIVGYLMGCPSVGAPELDCMSDKLLVDGDKVPPEFYLQITFVSRAFRNRGISTRLHKAVIDHARKQGHKEIYACIAKWNDPELNVIRSLKFQFKDLGFRYRLTLKL